MSEEAGTQNGNEPSETPTADLNTMYPSTAETTEDSASEPTGPASEEGGKTVSTGGKQEAGAEEGGDKKADDKQEADAEEGDDKKADAEEGDDKKADAEEAKPVKVELPDDLKSKVDENLVSQFEDFATEMGLDSEKSSEFVEKFVNQQIEMQEKQINEWYDTVQKDPEMGGNKFDETAQLSAKAIEHFGSEEAKDLLDQTGLGNHPALVRMFRDIGEAMREAKIPEGSPARRHENILNKLYPTLNEQRSN